jgi:hypothetical protein
VNKNIILDWIVTMFGEGRQSSSCRAFRIDPLLRIRFKQPGWRRLAIVDFQHSDHRFVSLAGAKPGSLNA